METLLARGSPLFGRFTGQWHLLERALQDIQDQLRAFVGSTAFEALCREWVSRAGQAGQLPLEVQQVGAHWSRQVQVDVVAVNWREKALLLGECKWGTDTVPREVVTERVEAKTPRVLKMLPDEGRGWTAHYALFARAGFTPAARALAQTHKAVLVDLKQLDRELEWQCGISRNFAEHATEQDKQPT